MYGREVEGKKLTFEASGALKDSALILRDRETDSWWSLMASQSIGGELDGTRLRELPGATKTTWTKWRRRHPDTLVLSIGGREHEPRDPYAGYFSDAKTFRNAKSKDRRLPAKEPIFAFWLDGQSYAVPHAKLAGGRRFDLGERGSVVLVREPDAALRASTQAYRIVDAALSSVNPDELALRVLADDTTGLVPLSGFDTFWYVWIAAQPQSELLGGAAATN